MCVRAYVSMLLTKSGEKQEKKKKKKAGTRANPRESKQIWREICECIFIYLYLPFFAMFVEFGTEKSGGWKGKSFGEVLRGRNHNMYLLALSHREKC